MPELVPPPFPVSLLICDGIHTDPYTDRRTLLGEFDEFYSPTLPAVIPVVWMFAEVTECRDAVRLRIRFATTDPEAEPIWETEWAEVVADTPLVRATVQWGVVNLGFPEHGVYMVQLVDGYDRVVIQRRLFIIGDQSSPEPETPDET